MSVMNTNWTLEIKIKLLLLAEKVDNKRSNYLNGLKEILSVSELFV